MKLNKFLLLVTLTTSPVWAQQADTGSAEADAPIRLEATIRANKEQPRVLSIVPWQLPRHRTIAGALEWQPANTGPRLLERSQFQQHLRITRPSEPSAPAQASDQ